MSETKKKGPASAFVHRYLLIAGILLFLIVFLACAFYARLITTPMDAYDISPASVPERWSFQLPDGRSLTVKDGEFPVSSDNAVLICRTQITEKLDDVPLIAVSANNSDCVFYLDDQLLYSSSGRYQDGEFSNDAYERGSASGQFALRNLTHDNTLTMIVQMQGEENRLSRLPKIMFYPGTLMYLSQYTAPVSMDAMAAGIFFTIAVFVAVLFLIGLWRGRKDAGMIWMALCSLSMAFSYTNSFSHQATSLFYSPAFVWFFSALPQLMIVWLLWHMLSRKLRLCTLPFAGGITVCIFVILVAGFRNRLWNTRMNAVTSWILPGVFFLLLFVGIAEAIRINGKYRRFFRYFLRAVLIAGPVTVFSALTGGKLAEAIGNAWSRTAAPDHSLYQACSLICTLLLLVSFIQALLELIEGLGRQDAELRTMALREKSAVENIAILRRSQEETRRYRHEMHHHMVVLDELISQKQEKQAEEYIHHLQDEITALPKGVYSDNLVVNAVVGYYLNEASADGIQVDSNIRISGELPLRDEELCVVLSNLLENALESCRAMEKSSERFIALTLSSNQEHMMILCENSTEHCIPVEPEGDIPSSKANAREHGYGIASVRRIADRHYGMLKFSCQEGRFKAELSI